MMWNQGLWTDLQAFTLQPRKTSENLSYKIVWWRLCDQSSPQMRFLPPNDIGKIAQHIREGEGREKRNDRQKPFCCPWSHGLRSKKIWTRVSNQWSLAPNVTSIDRSLIRQNITMRWGYHCIVEDFLILKIFQYAAPFLLFCPEVSSHFLHLSRPFTDLIIIVYIKVS